MTTYSKETALYDTGAIATDIDTAGNNYKKNITTVGDTGVKVHPYDSTQGQAVTSDYALIDSTGMTVVENDEQRAKFGSTTIIGKPYDSQANDNESHVEIDYHSLKLVDKENNIYFHVSDLRDSSGNVTATYTGDGVTTIFESLSGTLISTVTEVTINGVSTTEYTYTAAIVLFTTAPSNGSTIVIKYIPDSNSASSLKAFTAGLRLAGDVGPMSFVENLENVASGFSSHAEGQYTRSTGIASHSEGSHTHATNGYAHSEGLYSHADGYCSHAQNYYTRAESAYQTVIGKNNVEDSADTYAFIIGNGAVNARSNALTVDWNGSIRTPDTYRYTTDWDTTTSPSSNIYKSMFETTDEDGDNLAYIGCNYGSDGGIQSVLGLHRNVGGSDIYHTFGLRIDSAGNRYYDNNMSTSVNGSTGKLYFYRFGNVVYFSTNGAFRSKSTSISSGTMLTQKVPSGYRPVADAYIGCAPNASNNWRLQFEPDGDISFLGNSAWNANMWVSGMWMTADPLP